jgi:hypothetical protein
MMKRHWAPTILDGHAYHGRPQKPRRLILLHRLDFKKMEVCRALLIRAVMVTMVTVASVLSKSIPIFFTLEMMRLSDDESDGFAR